jgi:hypothetical protein
MGFPFSADGFQEFHYFFHFALIHLILLNPTSDTAWDRTPKKTPTVASPHCCVSSRYQVMSFAPLEETAGETIVPLLTPQAYSVHVTVYIYMF